LAGGLQPRLLAYWKLFENLGNGFHLPRLHWPQRNTLITAIDGVESIQLDEMPQLVILLCPLETLALFFFILLLIKAFLHKVPTE
jgi:hypothetical protein